MEEFKQYYKFPLKMWEFTESKVFTDDNKMAFDWLVNIPRNIKQKLIDRINGINTEPYKTKKIFYQKDGIVYCQIEGKDQEQKLFRIRGWGMLTGVGGYNLSADKAAEIQDAFTDYCVEMLNKKIIMTAEKLKQEIYNWMPNKPKNWREGQAVFNYVDQVYGVARDAQFGYNIDCFYDDSKIDAFIETCAEIISNNGK